MFYFVSNFLKRFSIICIFFCKLLIFFLKYFCIPPPPPFIYLILPHILEYMYLFPTFECFLTPPQYIFLHYDYSNYKETMLGPLGAWTAGCPLRGSSLITQLAFAVREGGDKKISACDDVPPDSLHGPFALC